MIRELLLFRLNFYPPSARNRLQAISDILPKAATKPRQIKNKPVGQALKCALLAVFSCRPTLDACKKTPAHCNILSTCGNVIIPQLLEA